MFTAATKLLQVVDPLQAWSQQGARRNALVACGALAQRRRELAEVEEFLATRPAPAATADARGTGAPAGLHRGA
jgi:hypothetical protein